MTEAEIRRIQFLDQLYAYQGEHPGELASVADFLDVSELSPGTEDVWRGMLRDLEERGIIMLAETMRFDGTSFMLQEAGRAEVEDRQRRRNDPARRARAARDSVIRLLYSRPGRTAPSADPILVTSEYFFEGRPLTKTDLNDALVYLRDSGLIEGIKNYGPGLLRPHLTKQGIDCAEHFGGSVSDYVRHFAAGGTQHNINFNAPVSGNVAWASDGVTQTATTTTGVSSEDVAIALQAILEALPSLGLAESEASTLTSNVRVIDGELAQQTPDAGVVKVFLHRTLETLGKATESSLALALSAYLKYLMQKAGIPVK